MREATAVTASRDETLEEVRAEVRELRELLVQLGRETVEAFLDTWRARIENLRVQADLARMDARDEVDASIDESDSRLRSARTQLASALHEADDVRSVLVDGLGAARSDLQAAVTLAEERIEAGRR
ncbi:MAG: hypothetical protein ACXVJA_08110 [Acidimicrobiia bacterium]